MICNIYDVWHMVVVCACGVLYVACCVCTWHVLCVVCGMCVVHGMLYVYMVFAV